MTQATTGSTPEPAANEAQLLQGSAAFAAKAIEMVSQAIVDVCILSDAMDPRLWGGSAFADALKSYLLQNDRARLRMLVNETPAAIHNVPHLIELVRRLTSRAEVRQPPDEHRQNYRGDLLIADRRQMLERHELGALEAKFWPRAPGVTQARAADFDEIWNESEPAQEFRSLGI